MTILYLICEIIQTIYKYPPWLQAHYGGGYACDYPGCTSVFKENAKLKRHKLVHTGEKAFKCDYCGLSFSLRHNLKTHEKTHTRLELENEGYPKVSEG